MKLSTVILALVATVTFASLMPVSSAIAQSAAGDETTKERDALEEITVTARRKAESQQSVPIDVEAFSNESLLERRIETTEDLQLSTPGVFLSGAGGREAIDYQIRGQSMALSGPSSPAVVTYFAEVPDPTLGAEPPQYDMSSIQVLKGPQGTLFGRNTTGGAVLFEPALPTYKFGGSVSAIGGNYGDQQYQAVVNLPLIDQRLAVRFAGNIERRDGYTGNLAGGTLDGLHSNAGRVSILYNPIDNISNVTIVDYYQHDGGFSVVPFGVGSGNTLLAELGLQAAALQQLSLQRARGPFLVNSPIDNYDNAKREGVTNRTEATIDGYTLINIFGYRYSHLDYSINSDGFPNLIADGTGAYPAGTPVKFISASVDNTLKQYSDEMQLRAKAFDNKLDWLFGAFYLKSEPDGPSGSQIAFAHVPGTPDAPASYNFSYERSKALFVHGTYDLGSVAEGLQFEAGFRYTWDSVTACTGSGVTATVADVGPDDCTVGNSKMTQVSTNSAGSDQGTWLVGLNWQLSRDLMTYIASRRGYRAGGINSPTLAGRLSQLQEFKPETVTDVEIGVRSDWDVGATTRVRLNASAYTGYYDSVQTAITGIVTSPLCNPASHNNPPGISPDGDCNTSNDPVGGTLLVNIGKSRVSGLDLDSIVALTKNFSFNLGAAFIAPQTRSIDIPPALAAYYASTSLPFLNTARKTATAGVRYSVPLPSPESSVNFIGDFYWTDRIEYTESYFPSYSLVNLSVNYEHVASSPVDLTFFLRNALNKEYIQGGSVAGTFIGLNTGIYGPPRMYGLEVRVPF